MTRISSFKKNQRLQLTVLLFLMSAFCMLLTVTRYSFSGSKAYLFLNWNLLLAAIPWMISSILIMQSKSILNRILTLFSLPVWLLFFPNAPYILTDLLHLAKGHSAPKWYDLTMILTFAWTGLLFGFSSLMDIEKLLSNYFNIYLTKITVILLLFAASFGVYLGRFLRWNSWDIINNPFTLFGDINDRIINPSVHMQTWGVTLLMGTLLNLMYWSLNLIKSRREIA